MFDHLRIWTTWKQCEQEYRKASVADTKDLEMLGKSIKNFLLCLRDQKVVGSREEREKERFKEVRKLSSDDALPRLRKAETADTRRLNQKILQKRIHFLQYFFIHCESNGISSPLGVYHHLRCISSTVGCISFAMMIYSSENEICSFSNG